MEEESNIKKSKWRKWMKYLFYSLFIALIITVFLFPPLYTKYILRPMLEEGFSQLTRDRYVLDFDKMRWKLFQRTVFLDHIRIQQANDSVVQPHIQYLELDTLALKGIHYFDLLTGEAKVKSIELTNLNLGLNLYSEKDSSEKLDAKVVNRSGFLHSLDMEAFMLNRFNLSISLNGDSLLQINQADFSVFHLFADSLNYPEAIALPNFESFNLQTSALAFQKNNTVISMTDLVFNESKKNNQATLEFAEFLHENLKNHNTQKLEEAVIKLDSVEWITDPEKSFLKGNELRLRFSKLVNSVTNPTREKPEVTLEKIKKSIEQSNFDFELNLVLVELNHFQQKHPQVSFEVNDLAFRMYKPLLHQEEFHFSSYRLLSDTMELFLKREGDRLSFSSFYFDQSRASLNIKDIYYLKQKGINSEMNLAMLHLEGFHPFQYLEYDVLKLSRLQMIKPDIDIHTLQTSKSLPQGFPILLDIDKLDIQDASFTWNEKGIKLKKADLEIDKILIPPGYSGDWENVFQLGKGNIGFIEYRSSDGIMDINTNALGFNTKFGMLSMEEMTLHSNYFSRKETGQLQVDALFVNGVNWKELLKRSPILKMDTLRWDGLEVIGSLAPKSSSKTQENNVDWKMLCSYLQLSQISANIHIKGVNEVSQIELDDVDISGSHIDMDLAKERFFDAESLLLFSQNSFYSNTKDSMTLRMNNWSFDLVQKKFDSHHLLFENKHQKDATKVKSQVKIDVDEVSIGGIDFFDMYLEKQFLFDSIYIKKPKLKLNGDRQTIIIYQANTKGFYQSLRHYVEKVKAIGFRDFILEDLSLSVKNRYLKRMDHIGLESFGMHIEDFFVDYKKFNEMDRFLFSENTSLEMTDYFQSINNGERLIYLKKAVGSTQDNRLQISDLRVLSLGDSISFPANISVKDILLNDLKMRPGNIQPHLFIGSLLLREPALDIKKSNQQKTDKKKFSLENIDLFKSIKGQLSSINIDRIELSNFDFSMPITIKGKSRNYDFKDIDLALDGIIIDSNNIAFANDRFFYCDDVRLNLPKFSMISPNRFYNFSFENMSLSSRDRAIRFDSVMMVSRYDRKTFVANLNHQTDQMDICIPVLKLEGIGYREAIFRNRYTLEKLELEQAQILIFKDKTLPPDTAIHKLMPAQAIESLRFYLNIDTIQFKDGFVKYEELSQVNNINGEIYFDHLTGRITGLSNDEDFRAFGGALKINAQARIMSEADVNLNAFFPLKSKDQEFVILASMNTLEVVSLNPLIQPLTRMNVRGGVLNQLQMNVKGNEEEGYGEMLLRYEDLKIEVLRKNMKESSLASFLANSILIKQNNNNIFRIRKGPIYFERVPYRGVIHYLAHFAIMGAKTSLGIDSRKTARKIKQIEKAPQE